jgi:hypothetical protein
MLLQLSRFYSIEWKVDCVNAELERLRKEAVVVRFQVFVALMV